MPMDKKVFEAVIQSIKGNTCGLKLDLGSKKINDAQATALAQVLAVNKTVQTLDLTINQIGDTGAAALAQVLAANKTVQKLFLNNNQIGDAGAKALAEALAVNKTVQKLFLNNNQIGDAGAKALAEALAVNKTVQTLDLNINQIGDTGAKALAEELATNKTVQTLDLICNRIGDAGAKALLELLKINTTLRSLNIVNNKISNAFQKAIKQALERNRALAEQSALPALADPEAIILGIQPSHVTQAAAMPALSPAAGAGAGPGPATHAGAAALLPLEIKGAAELNTTPKSEVKAAIEATKIATLPTIPRIAWKQLTLGDLIGNGSYGDVYKGKWHGVTVAIKKLQLKTLSPAMTKEFEKESDMMMQCQFPSVVRLYGICTEPGHFAMVMEYLPTSLRQRLQDEKPLSWLKRLTLGLEIAQGLAYLHNRNILHRDLKSLNILLDTNEHAKIADFGLAKVKLEVGSTSTKTHKSVGSVRWRAPELFKRHAIATPASDVYSLGMLLWELASRQLPYSDAADEQTVISWIKDEEQEKIPEDCPKTLAELIQSCWAAPDKRPTAAAVVDRLQAVFKAEEAFLKEHESEETSLQDLSPLLTLLLSKVDDIHDKVSMSPAAAGAGNTEFRAIASPGPSESPTHFVPNSPSPVVAFSEGAKGTVSKPAAGDDQKRAKPAPTAAAKV